MAFYDKVPGRAKKKDVRNSSWEEEGTRYSRGDRKSASGSSQGKSAGAGVGGSRSNGRPAANKNGGFVRGGANRNAPRGDRPYGRPAPNAENSERRSFGRPSGDRPLRRGFDRLIDDRPPQRSSRRPEADRMPPRPMEAAPSYLDSEYKPAPRRDGFRPVPPRPVRAPRLSAEDAADMPAENLLTGRNPIREALKSGRDIEKLMVQRGELSGSAREIVMMAREAHVIVQEVDKVRLDEIAPHHQGMVAYASAYAYSSVPEILAVAEERGEAPFIIVLDGITDPHNLGAVIRTAECTGAHGVIIPERRSVGLTPAAVKASAGAVEHIKVARVTNLSRTLEELKEKGVWTYAVTMEGEDYRRIDFTGGAALVIGSEGEGISRLVLEKCDHKVSLPMKGQLDSLNASVAAGVMMYQILAARV